LDRSDMLGHSPTVPITVVVVLWTRAPDGGSAGRRRAAPHNLSAVLCFGLDVTLIICSRTNSLGRPCCYCSFA
jgi:hypothetical protein